jgi:hypothetical protein
MAVRLAEGLSHQGPPKRTFAALKPSAFQFRNGAAADFVGDAATVAEFDRDAPNVRCLPRNDAHGANLDGQEHARG